MSTKYQESKDVPTETIYARLDELSTAITKGRAVFEREFTMRVPAELDRDADLVLNIAAKRLKHLNHFYSSVACLFAEGVEFMTKAEVCDAIKHDFESMVL